MILWSLYFITERFNVEWRSCRTTKQRNLVVWSVMMTNDSVYSVPMANSRGLVMTLSFVVTDTDGSSSLMAMKIFRYFIGRFTEFSY